MEKIEKEIRNERIKTELTTHDFYYDLPEELIAQSPSEVRDRCRLMVLDRETGKTEHKIFTDILDYIKPDYCAETHQQLRDILFAIAEGNSDGKY